MLNARRVVLGSLVGVLTMGAPVFVGAATKKTTAKPADATAQCNDGSYSKAKTQQGACARHGGVKEWYGEAATAAPATSKTTTTAKASTKAKAKATETTPATSATTAAPTGASKTSKEVGTKVPEKPVVAAPAGAPEGATAKCKDGTFSHAKTHSGACSRHGGVAEWYK